MKAVGTIVIVIRVNLGRHGALLLVFDGVSFLMSPIRALVSCLASCKRKFVTVHIDHVKKKLAATGRQADVKHLS